MLVLAAAMSIPGVSAGAPKPQEAQAMVERVTEQILEDLRSEPPESVENEAAWLREQVGEIVAPRLDFITMTKLAVGSLWRKASKEQKRELVTQFRELLLRTYSQALTQYEGQQVEFLPLQEGDRKDRARVRARVTHEEGPSLGADYRLRYHDGKWLVYDISVDGVSLVTNYRSTFTSLIREEGLEGLIQTLQQKNAQNDVLRPDSS